MTTIINGSSPSITYSDGSTQSTAAITWQTVKTANFTAVSGLAYPVNTTSGAITVTLPASPSAGNFVTIVDYAGTALTNAITINPNGSKINSSTNNLVIALSRISYNLVYIDATQGWISYAQQTSNFSYTASYLIVGGGGSGGSSYTAGYTSGGGGAGGLLSGTQTLFTGTNYSVVIGAGGVAPTPSTTSVGLVGNASTALSLSASGGGGGVGGTVLATGGAGGSGGGGGGGGTGSAGGSGTSGQGFAGGTGESAGNYGGAGGGGSAAVGSNGATPGNGGVGTVTTLITTAQATSASVGQVVSTSVYFAGGGGGGKYTGTATTGGSGGGGAGGNASVGTIGGVNTGGGGGGGANGVYAGGNGGSGCVILSIPTSNYSGTITGSPTVITNGSNTVIIFKSSGSYTA